VHVDQLNVDRLTTMTYFYFDINCMKCSKKTRNIVQTLVICLISLLTEYILHWLY